MLGGLKFRILVAGIIATAGCLVAAGAGVADTTNTDPTGDAKGGAPDITQVFAANDPAGLLTLRLTTVAPITDSSIVGVDLDTDANPATGAAGAEYSLIAGTGGFGMLKWNGSTFESSPAPTLTMTRSGNVIEFKINRSDIGSISRFGFAAFAANFDSAGTFLGEDDAPDGGEYTYALVFTQCANGRDDDGDGKVDAADLGCSSSTDNLESDDPVTLKAGKAKVVPAKPKAGKLVVVSAPVTRVETGAGVSSGTAKCVVRVGTSPVAAKGKVAAGRGSCTFKTPAKSKGKTVRGSITVTVLGKSSVIPFSFKVG
jgi:hypothetical protein